MEINYDNYYGAIFHIEVPPGELPIPFGPFGHGGSLMMHYFRKGTTERPTGPAIWYLVNTFRYFADDSDDGGEDKYSTQTMVSTLKTEDDMDRSVVDILSKLATKNGLSRFECVNLRCPGTEFLAKVRKADKDWLIVDEENFKQKNPDFIPDPDEQ